MKLLLEVLMAVARPMVSFEAMNGLDQMISRRAEQEGISVSDYVREAIILELWFSGDIEAMKFVAKRVGKRAKEMLLDKVAKLDIKERVEALEIG